MTNIPKQLQVNNSDFIVGDTVVFTEEKSCDCDLYEVEAVLDGGLFLGISHYRQAFSARNLRHATVAETKAKRRLPEPDSDMGDDQHIENNISPKCKTISNDVQIHLSNALAAQKEVS